MSVPAENALGNAHDNISLNRHLFEAGQTYKVPPQVAETVRDRIKVYNRSCVRLLQPRRDYESENAVSIGSAKTVGSRATDPSTF